MLNLLSRHLPVSLKHNSERLAFLGLAGSISLVLISIAASQILLAVTIVGYIWMLRQHEGRVPPGTSAVLPLLAFMSWTLVAVFASSNITMGLTITRKFYLLLLVPLVPLIVRGKDRVTWIYKAIFAVATFSSLLGLAQFVANPHRDLVHRISGFMSQWMTYSGLLMLVLMLLTAYAFCSGVRSHKWVIPVGALIVLALIFSLTRNTWAGAIAGIIVLMILRRPRAISVFLLAILVLYILSPASIKQRLQSGLDTHDSTTRTRIECFWTAIHLIRDNPWFGVGPKNVKYEALKYRREHEFPDWVYQHMHNNALQIAAETGIPGLVIWLWFMARLAWDAARCYRHALKRSYYEGEELRSEALTAASAALAAWVALMIAGMAEYNFGDSEVLTLFLFIMSAPYAFSFQSPEVPR